MADPVNYFYRTTVYPNIVKAITTLLFICLFILFSTILFLFTKYKSVMNTTIKY